MEVVSCWARDAGGIDILHYIVTGKHGKSVRITVFSIDYVHLMYNAHPRLFGHSF
jgi:hypothetical protein